MRRRVTFIHPNRDALDPNNLHHSGDTVRVQGLRAAREDRLIASLYELPQELWRALKQCHELHIRWVAPRPYHFVAPFVSTIPAGLHVSFTPSQNQEPGVVCSIVAKTFGSNLDCSAQGPFTKPSVPSKRFNSAASLQYYELLPSLQHLSTYVQEKICPSSNRQCGKDAVRMMAADYVDIDYDRVSQSFTFSAFHHKAPASEVGQYVDTWDEPISKHTDSIATEVGFFGNEKPTESEELSLGGFLLTLGKGTNPKPTLFSFPSRHHKAENNLDSIFSAHFTAPIGLHPTLRLMFPRTLVSPHPACALHAYLTPPSALFPDKYLLSSPNFLASKNLRALRALSGETDLEAPNWAVSKWGSAMLLELKMPPTHEPGWHVDVPLHLRYMSPHSAPGLGTEPGQVRGSMSWPAVFWACPSNEGTKMNTNPFDRVNLGYDSIFGPRTKFYHLSPLSNCSLVETISIPVLEVGRTAWVESGTVGAIAAGFVWICWCLFRSSINRGSIGNVAKTGKKQ